MSNPTEDTARDDARMEALEAAQARNLPAPTPERHDIPLTPDEEAEESERLKREATEAAKERAAADVAARRAAHEERRESLARAIFEAMRDELSMPHDRVKSWEDAKSWDVDDVERETLLRIADRLMVKGANRLGFEVIGEVDVDLRNYFARGIIVKGGSPAQLDVCKLVSKKGEIDIIAHGGIIGMTLSFDATRLRGEVTLRW